MSEDIVRFERDDEGYLAWLAANPTGFVVNCAPNPSTDYLVLHRASCMHISVLGTNMEHWTHEYINGALRGTARCSAGVRRRSAADPRSARHAPRSHPDPLIETLDLPQHALSRAMRAG